MKLYDEKFIDELVTTLLVQLHFDDKRWGDTWRKRGLKGQEKRTMERFRDYYDMFQNNDTPMPWMKIIGGAYICWLRENHPDLLLCDPSDSCESINV